MNFSKMLVLFVFGMESLLLSAHAEVRELQQVIQVHSDQNGMPRCLETQGGGLLFIWNKADRYSRKIRAIRIQDIPVRFYESPRRPCQDWNSYNVGGVPRIEVPQGAAEIDGVSLPVTVQLALEQIRLGGKKYATPDENESLLESSEPFTRKRNRQLMRDYGIGFANRAYQASVENKPENQAFSGLVKAYLRNEEAAPALSQRMAGITVLLVPGYMQSPKNDRLSALRGFLGSMGLDIQMAPIVPTGDVASNSKIVARHLTDLLSENRSVILMGGSKGVPEMLSALAQVEQARKGLGAQAPGKVISVVNLAGMISGSFIVDWGKSWPQRWVVLNQLKTAAEDLGVEWVSDEGFENMGTEFLTSWTKGYLPLLPKDIPYFSVLGVPRRDGLVRDKEISSLQGEWSRKFYAPHGGNDGYIEFPGTSLPAGVFPRHYELVFDSSHILLDGYFEGLDLSFPENQKRTFGALFQAVMDYCERSN